MCFEQARSNIPMSGSFHARNLIHLIILRPLLHPGSVYTFAFLPIDAGHFFPPYMISSRHYHNLHTT
jgi:hypothetical protein